MCYVVTGLCRKVRMRLLFYAEWQSDVMNGQNMGMIG